MDSRVITLTSAAHKYGNLNICPCGREFFPPDVFGSPSKKAGLGTPITLKVSGLKNPVKTDIPTDKKTGRPRWIFRERSWVKEFVHFNNLLPGNIVSIHRLSKNTYFITPTKSVLQIDLFEQDLSPVLYAQKLAEQYIESVPLAYRKKRGQYFTPPEIAKFMAKLAMGVKGSSIRILEPGAGLGILSCAVCEQLARRNIVNKIEIHTFENDSNLFELLHRSLAHTSKWLKNHFIHVEFKIIDKDFIQSATSLSKSENFYPYDIIIANPPYLKISANDPKAQALREVVYGQPNLYALFMTASVKLLKNSGLMVFITPRSYSTGCYFKSFRKFFFDNMNLVRAHLFESRKDIFSKQPVLQESVIIKAIKGVSTPNISVSVSMDAKNLNSCIQKKLPLADIIIRRKDDIVFRLPVDDVDEIVTNTVDSWTATLSDYNLKISTGPVVPFRAEEFIPKKSFSIKGKKIPLLWMQNIQAMQTVWPSNGSKNRKAACQFIIDNASSRRRKLLLPNKNMVFLRRFSAKEQKRRLTAAPLFQEQLHFNWIGVENHLNYIYKPNFDMTANEVEGLAAILNSSLLDRYFRICNGNTQVSATELRAMPLPPWNLIVDLGKQLRHLRSTPTLEIVDQHVCKIIGPFTKKKKLLKRLID